MKLETYPLPPIATNAYLLLDQESRSALLFDAPWQIWQTIQPRLEETGCRLLALLLTHGHWDHAVEVALLAEHGVPVYAHRSDLELIESLPQMASYLDSGPTLMPGKVDHFLEDGEELSLIEGEPMEVRHVPGHSPGSILFYFKNQKLAVVGDTLFSGTVGRTDISRGDSRVLKQSILKKIYTLPNETVIYPGHGLSTTVGWERENNMLVRG